MRVVGSEIRSDCLWGFAALLLSAALSGAVARSGAALLQDPVGSVERLLGGAFKVYRRHSSDHPLFSPELIVHIDALNCKGDVWQTPVLNTTSLC